MAEKAASDSGAKLMEAPNWSAMKTPLQLAILPSVIAAKNPSRPSRAISPRGSTNEGFFVNGVLLAPSVVSPRTPNQSSSAQGGISKLKCRIGENCIHAMPLPSMTPISPPAQAQACSRAIMDRACKLSWWAAAAFMPISNVLAQAPSRKTASISSGKLGTMPIKSSNKSIARPATTSFVR